MFQPFAFEVAIGFGLVLIGFACVGASPVWRKQLRMKLSTWVEYYEINIIKHEFPDHHPFTAGDLNFDDELPVVMTEKDAVKCREFANEGHWYLPIKAELPVSFNYRLDNLMKEIIDGQEIT